MLVELSTPQVRFCTPLSILPISLPSLSTPSSPPVPFHTAPTSVLFLSFPSFSFPVSSPSLAIGTTLCYGSIVVVQRSSLRDVQHDVHSIPSTIVDLRLRSRDRRPVHVRRQLACFSGHVIYTLAVGISRPNCRTEPFTANYTNRNSTKLLSLLPPFPYRQYKAKI